MSLPKILPPPHHFQHAGLHWIAEIDPDGRPEAAELYQWQPSAKAWCKPDDIATGRDVTLDNHVYVSPAPGPLPKYFLEQMAEAIERIDQVYTPLTSDTVTISNEDWNMIRRLMFSLH